MGALARFLWSAALGLALPAAAEARTAVQGDTIRLQEMVLTVPEGWSLRQDAKDDGMIILGFEKGAEYVTLFVKQETGLDMRALFVNGSRIVRDVRDVSRNEHAWKVIETSKQTSGRTTYVAAFLTEKNGHSYYGYGRGNSSATALEAVTSFLQELR